MIDIQYLLQVSGRLDRFKKKSQNLYNFRCVYCGDSKRKKSKARAYVYRVKNSYFYKCHNCGKGTTIGKLIEYCDPILYKQYVIEKYKTGNTATIKEPEFTFKPVKFEDKMISQLTRLDKIPYHPAYELFIKKRKLEDHADKLYVTWHFMKWVNSIIPNKFPKIITDQPRIVIPFFDVSNKMFAFQGRAFGNETPKYITIKLDENKRRIFGLDRLNISDTIYVTEGPIDSLFLPNAIAVAGADLEIKNLKNKAVYIFDNEPRNSDIVKKLNSLIEKNYSVVIWPKEIKYKDINDMIINDMTPDEILNIISINTYSKLAAIQKLNNWKEI